MLIPSLTPGRIQHVGVPPWTVAPSSTSQTTSCTSLQRRISVKLMSWHGHDRMIEQFGRYRGTRDGAEVLTSFQDDVIRYSRQWRTGSTVHDRNKSPWTRPRSHWVQHTCEVLSSTHTSTHHLYCRLIHGELARLASPKWKFIHHRRKMSTDDLGRTDSRIWGPTVSEHDGALDMEYSERQRNWTHPHARRIKMSKERSIQGNDNERQMLVMMSDETGRHSVSLSRTSRPLTHTSLPAEQDTPRKLDPRVRRKIF
jgi:hypothetical protein